MYRERKAPKPAGPAIPSATGIGSPPDRRPVVLVLDDSAAQRKMLVTMLRRWGFQAVACDDAREALMRARDPAIGLIVSDWVMPGMSGPDFCRRLRETGREGYQYILLLTSKSETSDLSEGLAAGADDFLTKPVTPLELRARLNAGARIVAMQAELVEKTRSLGEALDEIRALYDAMDADLDEARRLQRSFLNEPYRRFDAAEVSLWLKSSGHVGGDMVGFFEVSPHVFGFYSMDVSGHGVAAGMLVARAAGMLRDNAPDLNVAMSGYGAGLFAAVPPQMVAAQLNTQILGEINGERYLTLCLGFLDQRNGLVRMVQAGHPSPLCLRADGTVERLGNGGLPLGLFAEARFEQFEVRLRAGDRLLLYSDGLTDCPWGADGMLEEDGLIELCRRHRTRKGAALLDGIAADLESRAGITDFPDDVSALVVSFEGGPPPGA